MASNGRLLSRLPNRGVSSEEFSALIARVKQKTERKLCRKFVDRHNAMVTTMNKEFERCMESFEQEVEDHMQEYKTYLGIANKVAMSNLGGTKTAPRYKRYRQEVDEAIKKHKRENPRKQRNKRVHKFGSMHGGEGDSEESDSGDVVGEMLAVAEAQDTADKERSEETSEEEEEEEEEEESSEPSDDELPAPVMVAPKKLKFNLQKK